MKTMRRRQVLSEVQNIFLEECCLAWIWEDPKKVYVFATRSKIEVSMEQLCHRHALPGVTLHFGVFQES